MIPTRGHWVPAWTMGCRSCGEGGATHAPLLVWNRLAQLVGRHFVNIRWHWKISLLSLRDSASLVCSRGNTRTYSHDIDLRKFLLAWSEKSNTTLKNKNVSKEESLIHVCTMRPTASAHWTQWYVILIWKGVSDKESGVKEDKEHRRAKIKSWKTLEGNYFQMGTLLRV